MSESNVGVRRAVTRQKVGSVLKAFDADAFVDDGTRKPPTGTLSAEVIAPSAIFICARASQLVGAAAWTPRGASSAPHASSAIPVISGPILI
jgi:hypothetical protein